MTDKNEPGKSAQNADILVSKTVFILTETLGDVASTCSSHPHVAAFACLDLQPPHWEEPGVVMLCKRCVLMLSAQTTALLEADRLFPTKEER